MLLSHPDTAHLGALPYLVGRLGLAAPVYATLPVHKMGQMFLYDHYTARAACSDFDAFTLDDVDAAFALVVPLRYQQTAALLPRSQAAAGAGGSGGGGAGGSAGQQAAAAARLALTPYAAGHLLGGAAWRIRASEGGGGGGAGGSGYGGDDVVYAVDWSQRRERHLGGSALEAAFSRPALMITDAWAALRPPADRAAVERCAADRCCLGWPEGVAGWCMYVCMYGWMDC